MTNIEEFWLYTAFVLEWLEFENEKSAVNGLILVYQSHQKIVWTNATTMDSKLENVVY